MSKHSPSRRKTSPERKSSPRIKKISPSRMSSLSIMSSPSRISSPKRRSSEVNQIFKNSCNKAFAYSQNFENPKLVLGATPSDSRNDRIFEDDLIFVDMRNDEHSDRLIICDLTNMKELEYLAKTFKHKLDKVIFDTGVLKDINWSVAQLKLVKKMLRSGGQFVMPAPNCRHGMTTNYDQPPMIINKQIQGKMIVNDWNPTENEFFQLLNHTWDNTHLTLSPVCFIPTSWHNRYTLNQARRMEISDKINENVIYYNDFLLKIVFKDVEFVKYKQGLMSEIGFEFAHTGFIGVFICS